MARRLYLVLPVLIVFVTAFAMVVSLHSMSAAEGSRPIGDERPGKGERANNEIEMAPGGCCQMLIADSNGGPPKAVFGVWTGSSCCCDGSAFSGSPCAFVCP